ncbi:DUF6434 domain-containing protein [Corynebacteriaceae bacterium 7-707]
MTAVEFQRWYWLKDELVVFAKQLGIRTTGGKELLAARIVAKLGGRAFTEPSTAKRSGGKQLSAPISPDTVIPVGQRCSQVVRRWMAERAGEDFHFDAEMRAFFAEADGTRTMQDAVDHWRATRGQSRRNIDPQFEYNRFTRSWHEQNPGSSRDELLAAWQDYRSRPRR